MNAPLDVDPGKLTVDAVLDTVGLYCPVPIIRTAARMRRVRPGGILEVVSDDRVILVDMPAWCRANGADYLGSRQEGSEYHLFIRKRGTSPALPPHRGDG